MREREREREDNTNLSLLLSLLGSQSSLSVLLCLLEQHLLCHLIVPDGRLLANEG